MEKVVGSTRSELDARFVKEMKKMRAEIDKKLKIDDKRGTDKSVVDRLKNEVNKKVITMEKDIKRMENSLAVQQKAIEVFKRETQREVEEVTRDSRDYSREFKRIDGRRKIIIVPGSRLAAIEILEKSGEKFEYPVSWGVDLQSDNPFELFRMLSATNPTNVDASHAFYLGYELAKAVIAAGLSMTSAPGPSAVLGALTVSGLPTDRFAFVGFLPATRAARETEIAALRDVGFTLVFYESPKRVGEMLGNLRDILGGERQAVVCRELTKKFEEVVRGDLATLAEQFKDRPVKGEIVVLVGRAGAQTISDADVATALREAMKTMRIKDAATTVAGALGLPRRQVYQIALGLGEDE